MLMPAVWSGRDRRPDKPRTLNATIPSCKDRIFPHKRVHRKTEFWYKCLNSPHKYVLSTYYMISIRGVQKQSKTRTKASDSIPPPTPHPPELLQSPYLYSGLSGPHTQPDIQHQSSFCTRAWQDSSRSPPELWCHSLCGGRAQESN